jgi:nitroreductase
VTYPLAESLQAASELADADAVRAWRTLGGDDEPRVPRDELLTAIRRRRSVRAYGADPGVYDASLRLVHPRDEHELRKQAGFAAMEQDHPKAAAVNVFQLADLDDVVGRLGERGYRWAQLEAGIRAGRLQIGAFMRGWGAAASTFYDEDVSKLLGTSAAPMLMVALGPRATRF